MGAAALGPPPFLLRIVQPGALRGHPSPGNPSGMACAVEAMGYTPMKHDLSRLAGAALGLLLAGSAWGDAASPPETTPAAYQTLPFLGSGNHLFVHDVDGDGRLDLGATSHGGNTLQIFFQDAPRVFTPGPLIPEVGFHPWDVMPVDALDGKYLLVFAEGETALRTLKPKGREGVELIVDRRDQPPPRSGVPVPWAGWQDSWLVSPFMGEGVLLYRGLDLLSTAAPREVLSLSRKGEPMRPIVVDINGDGIQEILFSTKKTGEVWVVRQPAADQAPQVEPLIKGERWDATKDVLAADLNDDGHPDLLLGQERYGRIDTYHNDGKGGFSKGPTLGPSAKAGPAHMAVATDRDGTQYILAANYKRFALFTRKTGAGPQFETLIREVGSWANFVVLRDIDGDGWLDAAWVMQHPSQALEILYGPLKDHFTTAGLSPVPAAPNQPKP